MKEIPESFDGDRPAAAAGPGRYAAAGEGAARSVRHHKGFNGGAILAAIGACVLAGVVFWISDSHFSHRGNLRQPQTAYGVVEEVVVVDATETPAAQVAQATTDDASTAAAKTAASSRVNANSAVAQAKPDAVYLFPTNGTAIADNADLNAVAKEAVADNSDVVVTAYTDETGSASYNQRLSEERARAIGDYLVAHGVARSHIKTQGCGPTHAFANNAQDRRAEVRIVS